MFIEVFFFLPQKHISFLSLLFLNDGTETQNELLPAPPISCVPGTEEISQNRAKMRAALPPTEPQESCKPFPSRARPFLGWIQLIDIMELGPPNK